jgi:hypothetical protein
MIYLSPNCPSRSSGNVRNDRKSETVKDYDDDGENMILDLACVR